MKLRRSSLEALRVFEACVRHGNYTCAAAELAISPAAVSQRMRNLQAEIGTPVFHRSGPRVTLSEAGRRLAERVAGAMAQLAMAVDECTSAERIRVSAAPTFAARWLAPRLARFTEHNGVAVTMDPAIDIRAPGSFDVAVRSGIGDWPGYDARALFPIECTPLYNPQICAAPIRRATDLLACQLINSDDWSRWFKLAGVAVPPGRVPVSAACYPTQDLAGAAAIDGTGVALLSPRMFQGAITRGHLVQPFETVLSGPESYWVLVSDGEARRQVLAFRDWLIATCENESDRSGGSES